MNILDNYVLMITISEEAMKNENGGKAYFMRVKDTF